MSKLKDRMDNYKELSDTKLLNRVPLIICINGRGFSKLTSLLEKPYCNKFAEGMLITTLKLCSEIEGAVFGYHFNDEIVIIVRNDQGLDTEPWFDNKVQKISSITSSIATSTFSKYINSNDLNIIGDSYFTSQVFAVPNIAEAINSIVFKQQQNFHSSIHFSCFYELLEKYDKNTIKEMLNGLSIDEKVNLLNQESNIDFNKYPSSFRRGAACYKIPKLTDDGIVKNQWIIDGKLPIFNKDQSFLSNILKHGSDIFRKENL